MSAPFVSYAEAIDYLYSFINWEVNRQDRYTSEVMTLDRPRRVLAAVGDPHYVYPVIHITGTKGKGSVGAMCAAACQASGLRAGLYSSPHLQDFRERFRVNNEFISPEDFTALVNQLHPVLETVKDITWFEVTTALAFMYFAQQKVDIAVIEVGLGGRLDATNVVKPVVSVITSLSYDHIHLLGDTLAAIAAEKGGIIKPGVPVVSAPQPPEALDVLAAIAAEQHSALTLIGRDWLYTPQENSWQGQEFLAGPTGQPLESYCTALPGEHQALNATVALAALDQVRLAGLPVTAAGIHAGLEQVDWPGRLEVVQRSPLLVLDVAHNAASARRLLTALDEMFVQRPLALLFGVFADKDVDGILEALLPAADYLVIAQAVHPRALTTDVIEALARQQGYQKPILQIADTRLALAKAEELVGPGGLVCTTGSVSLVGEIRTVCSLPVGHVVPLAQQPVAQ
ncbi:MAG: bifunctional folylpolyglutamate synthase/dihydrofolate synthase [Chloroflexi bacterium]|nr:bifunctional folylpolyglutamate synthase/dihydrofolate synthase [Chloroflexota bacterium]